MKHILACLLFALSAHVAAQTYVVGVEKGSFMPHYGVDEQGQYRGFARELLDLFAQYAGVTFTYKPLPVDQLVPALAEGKVDFKYPDHPDWAHSAKTADRMSYSQPIVEYVDGTLVTPRRVGQALDHLKRLGLVEGWTARGYQEKIEASQILVVPSDSLPEMIRQALLKNSDGVYYNVVVALHYINNVRARPGVLVFDPTLPHTRSAYRLSTIRHAELLQRFDSFLTERQEEIAALKDKYQVEANIGSEYFGMEQWKVDFLKRQKAKDASAPSD